MAAARPSRSPAKLLVYVVVLGVVAGVGYYGYLSLRPVAQEGAASGEPSNRRGSTAAAEAGNAPPAVAKLAPQASPRPVGGTGPRSGETPGPSPVQRLLREADQHWQAGRLTEPSGANAFETYSRALELDPENVEAKQRLVGIGRINAANKMFLAAERLLRSGEIDGARRMIETGLKINPDDDRLLGLRRALE